MLTAAAKAQATNSEAKLDVGWQKLTSDEFLDALTSAVIETLQNHRSPQTAKPAGENSSIDS